MSWIVDVTTMQSVLTLWAATSVPVTLDILETDTPVQVSQQHTLCQGNNYVNHHPARWYSCDSNILCLYTDVNECETNSACHEHADCHDTDGSYLCECRAGFMGDGYNCTGQLTEQREVRNDIIMLQ